MGTRALGLLAFQVKVTVTASSSYALIHPDILLMGWEVMAPQTAQRNAPSGKGLPQLTASTLRKVGTVLAYL